MDKAEQKIPSSLFKKIKRIELKAGHLVSDISSGGYSSVFRGQGIEFQEVRSYIPGDDIRKIDWNVTARNNAPYVKQYKEERELHVMMLLDVSGSLQFGSREKRKKDMLIELSALLAFTALSNQDKIGAVLFSDQIEQYVPPTKKKNSILRMIRDVLFYTSKSTGTDINAAISFLMKTMKRKGVVFIMSDFYTAIDSSLLFHLSRKQDVIPVIIDDPFESSIVDAGLIDAVDNETGKKMLIDTSSSSYKKFISDREEQRENFLSELKKYNITPLIVSTYSQVENEVLAYFAKRKRMRK